MSFQNVVDYKNDIYQTEFNNLSGIFCKQLCLVSKAEHVRLASNTIPLCTLNSEKYRIFTVFYIFIFSTLKFYENLELK